MNDLLKDLIGIDLKELTELFEKDEVKRSKIKSIIHNKEEKIIIKANFEINSNMYAEKRKNNREFYLEDLIRFNIFDNFEDADIMAKKINAELKLYHISKFLNGSWKPNWNDETEMKYFLAYEKDKQPTLYFTFSTEIRVIVFRSKEMLPEIIRLMGEQSIKDYFIIER